MNKRLSQLILKRRLFILALFSIFTVLAACQIPFLKTNIGLSQSIPQNHSFITTTSKYQKEFGSGNQIIISLEQKQGDIFNPDYMKALEKLSRQVSLIDGVDQSRIMSLFSTNIRFTEITENGFTGGTVLPENFQASDESLKQLKTRILKSAQAKQLVSDSFNASLVIVELTELNQSTGRQLNYSRVSSQLNKLIRQEFDDGAYNIKIIGYAELMGEIKSAIDQTIWFFLISFMFVFIILTIALKSVWLALLPTASSICAITLLLGTLSAFNVQLHPFGIFVPFLIFAIGTSHGLQLVQSVKKQLQLLNINILTDKSRINETAIINSHSTLLVPGFIALLSDCIGFITILFIDIPAIREMAITASLGIAFLILSNLFLLPVLLHYFRQTYASKLTTNKHNQTSRKYWKFISQASNKSGSIVILFISLILLVTGSWQASRLTTGDLHYGVPELRSNATYNQSLKYFNNHFSRGTDTLVVYASSNADACIEYQHMKAIDDFVWEINKLPAVLAVNAITINTKNINTGWHEGSLKWHNIPNTPAALGEAVAPIDTKSGLLNHDCSVMPIYIYVKDHQAETVNAIISKTQTLKTKLDSENMKFELAAGSIANHAATNDVIEQAQLPILVTIYLAIGLLCFFTFKSIRATICIILPLSLVSILCYALMVSLEIGLKLSTLPVIALGAGIGVDYAIYLFSYFKRELVTEIQDSIIGSNINIAFIKALESGGSAIIYTALTLSFSLIIWIYSPLKYQADMGLLLAFMFIVNMFAALLLMPALIRWVYLPLPGIDKPGNAKPGVAKK